MERKELLDLIYNNFDEDARLTKSRQGMLEYRTTMHYLHKYLKSGAKILELGAGTGRYSIALAKEGFDVTAVELVEHNLDELRKNAQGVEHIVSYQGDALDLSRFGDGEFDAVLVFGPLYHLYEKADQMKALEEAVRVTKKGGVLFTAFLSVYEIMFSNYLVYGNFDEGLRENYDDNYRVKHFTEQGFTGFDIEEFEALFDTLPTEKLALAGVDSVLEIAELVPKCQLTDEDFDKFTAYHLATCEKRELLGTHSHLLYICRTK